MKTEHLKSYPLNRLLVCVLLSLFQLSYAQDHNDAFSMKAVLFDSLNHEVIPYVSIYKTRDKKSTLSGFDGAFSLENVLANDSIIFSAIGYEKTLIVVNVNFSYDTIIINRETQLLEEVIVLGDSSILYELVSAVRKKTKSAVIESSRAYFELESYHNEKQLELFQGYYNGTYKNYNVVDLEMKNGRFALAPIDKRIFASTESSKALYMHNLLETNDFFPKSPFELSKRNLKKYYSLELNAKYTDRDGKTIYVISFKPRQDLNSFFSGSVWIDSLTNNVLKTKLSVLNATVHPFSPIWSIHTLDTVTIELTKSFEIADNRVRLNTVHFNYDLIYKSPEDSSLNISTRAVLHAYNYNDGFTLPFFNFPNASNADYRRIQMLPYNNEFWECTDEFKIENNSAKNAFIKDQATIRAYDLFTSDTIIKKNFFENPYISWSGNRIKMKGISAEKSKYYDARRTLNTDRYRLKVQLFVDVNELCDSVQIITKTIFDPYESFYNFETTNESQAFINIYFDLMEIERAKLAIALEQVKNDRKSIEEVYFKATENAEKLSNTYFKEVQRGTNKTGLKKWNTFVINELNIDNINFFKVEIK